MRWRASLTPTPCFLGVFRQQRGCPLACSEEGRYREREADGPLEVAPGLPTLSLCPFPHQLLLPLLLLRLVVVVCLRTRGAAQGVYTLSPNTSVCSFLVSPRVHPRNLPPPQHSPLDIELASLAHSPTYPVCYGCVSAAPRSLPPPPSRSTPLLSPALLRAPLRSRPLHPACVCVCIPPGVHGHISVRARSPFPLSSSLSATHVASPLLLVSGLCVLASACCVCVCVRETVLQ